MAGRLPKARTALQFCLIVLLFGALAPTPALAQAAAPPAFILTFKQGPLVTTKVILSPEDRQGMDADERREMESMRPLCAQVDTSNVPGVATGDLVCAVGEIQGRTVSEFEDAIRSANARIGSIKSKAVIDFPELYSSTILSGVFGRATGNNSWGVAPLVDVESLMEKQLASLASSKSDEDASPKSQSCAPLPPPTSENERLPQPGSIYLLSGGLVTLSDGGTTRLCAEVDQTLGDGRPGRRDFICSVNGRNFTQFADLAGALRTSEMRSVKLFGLWGCGDREPVGWATTTTYLHPWTIASDALAQFKFDSRAALMKEPKHFRMLNTAEGSPASVLRNELFQVQYGAARCEPNVEEKALALIKRVNAAMPAAIYRGGQVESEAHAAIFIEAMRHYGVWLVCQKQYDRADAVWASALEWGVFSAGQGIADVTRARRDLAVQRRAPNADELRAAAGAAGGARGQSGSGLVVMDVNTGATTEVGASTSNADTRSVALPQEALSIISAVENFRLSGNPEIAGSFAQQLARRLVDAYRKAGVKGSREAAGLNEDVRNLQRAAEQVFSLGAQYSKQFGCADLYWLGLAMTQVGQSELADAAFARGQQAGRTGRAAQPDPYEWRCDSYEKGNFGNIDLNPIDEGLFVKARVLGLINVEKTDVALNVARSAIAFYPPRFATALSPFIYESQALAEEALGQRDAAAQSWRKAAAIDIQKFYDGRAKSALRKRAAAAAVRMKDRALVGEMGEATVLAVFDDPLTAATTCLNGMTYSQMIDGTYRDPEVIEVCKRVPAPLRAAGRAADAVRVVQLLKLSGELEMGGSTKTNLAEDALEALWAAGKP